MSRPAMPTKEARDLKLSQCLGRCGYLRISKDPDGSLTYFCETICPDTYRGKSWSCFINGRRQEEGEKS